MSSIRLTISTEDNVVGVEVDCNETIENLKALIEVETQILVAQQQLFFNGRVLDQSAARLSDVGVGNDDLLEIRRLPTRQEMQQMHQMQQQQARAGSGPIFTADMLGQTLSSLGVPAGAGSGPGARAAAAASARAVVSVAPTPPALAMPPNTSTLSSAPWTGADGRVDAAQMRAYFGANPQMLQQLFTTNPDLAEAVLSADVARLQRMLDDMAAMQRQQRANQAEEERLYRLLEANPFDLEAQRELEERIRESNVNENMESAIEHSPEAFGRVVMLYIDCQVQQTEVKAFVDSGAQSTIMSAACAERCGILRLIDRRFHGVAMGVGTAKILGRVHLAPIRIGKNHFPCSFTILEGQSMDFLLGLDMLRRHQACIDLRAGVLRIGEEEVPFLSEKDIPASQTRDLDEAGDTQMLQGDASSGSGSGSGSGSSDGSSSAASRLPQGSLNVTGVPRSASASASSSASAPSAAAAAPTSGDQFGEPQISALTQLGAPRDTAIAALRLYNGNTEQAAAHLFS